MRCFRLIDATTATCDVCLIGGGGGAGARRELQTAARSEVVLAQRDTGTNVGDAVRCRARLMKDRKPARAHVQMTVEQLYRDATPVDSGDEPARMMTARGVLIK